MAKIPTDVTGVSRRVEVMCPLSSTKTPELSEDWDDAQNDATWLPEASVHSAWQSSWTPLLPLTLTWTFGVTSATSRPVRVENSPISPSAGPFWPEVSLKIGMKIFEASGVISTSPV